MADTQSQTFLLKANFLSIKTTTYDGREGHKIFVLIDGHSVGITYKNDNVKEIERTLGYMAEIEMVCTVKSYQEKLFVSVIDINA